MERIYFNGDEGNAPGEPRRDTHCADDGKEIRDAVRGGDFLKVLIQCWEAAVNL